LGRDEWLEADWGISNLACEGKAYKLRLAIGDLKKQSHWLSSWNIEG
jgi:hypothetical protein